MFLILDVDIWSFFSVSCSLVSVAVSGLEGVVDVGCLLGSASGSLLCVATEGPEYNVFLSIRG